MRYTLHETVLMDTGTSPDDRETEGDVESLTRAPSNRSASLHELRGGLGAWAESNVLTKHTEVMAET